MSQFSVFIFGKWLKGFSRKDLKKVSFSSTVILLFGHSIIFTALHLMQTKSHFSNLELQLLQIQSGSILRFSEISGKIR